MRLYDSSVSGNAYKVRLLLAHLDIPFERIELSVVDRSNRADVIGGKNPALRIPVLELDDGTTLAESNAILMSSPRALNICPRGASSERGSCSGSSSSNTITNRTSRLRDFCCTTPRHRTPR